MNIAYKKENDKTIGIQIGNTYFEVEQLDENYCEVNIPKYFLANFPCSELQSNLVIKVCDEIREVGYAHNYHTEYVYSGTPYSISKVSDDKVSIEFEEVGRRKYWDGDVGYRHYMEAKKRVIEERAKRNGDITLETYDDDGDYIGLTFCVDIETNNLNVAVSYAEQILNEIEGTTQLEIDNKSIKLQELKNEAQFTLQILIPLLRNLGFSDIRYSHGKREYGKDIIFSRKTEFDDFEYWGVQVKYGNISGGAKSDVDNIISQAEDAFRMPFYDLYTKSKKRISKLLIIISGKFTENAVEKICEGIERYSLKNNLVFIDGDKIEIMINRYSNK